MMKRNLRWLFMGILLLAGARPGQAFDMVHVITLSLKITVEGPPEQNGDVVTIPPVVVRSDTRTFISAIAKLRGQTTYPLRSQLLLVRHNVGQENASASLVIRWPGHEDWPVEDYFGFGGEEGILAGQINTLTGRERTTLTYPGRMSVLIPEDITFDLTGIAVEKRASIRLNNQEIDAGMTSASFKLSGTGSGLGDFEPRILVEGTMNLGAGKVVQTP